MKQGEKKTISESEALVLQQVHENGEDNTRTLSQQLGMSRHHVINVITKLKQKGLVAIDNDIDGLWVHLTNKGSQLMRYMWPEAYSVLA